MAEPLDLAALRRRHAELSAAIARAAEQPQQREAVRDAIVELFNDTERMLAEAAEFKESIRPLVDEYKRAFARPTAPSRRVDHLGSSTFQERAWNAIAGCDYEAAIREATRALDLAPGTQSETLLAWAQMRLGRLEEARTTLESVLAREADHALARACLGYVALQQGRFAEAIEHLSRTLRADTDRKATLYANLYLGMVYAEREMYRDARGFYARALELGPYLIEAYWELGRSFYREGDREQAHDAWRRGAAANRFNAWGERCQRAAEQLAAGQPVAFD